MEKELIHLVNQQIDTAFEDDISIQELFDKLSVFVNDLIQHDFQKLVLLLYKVDVDENKLKKILKDEAGKDAAGIIAGLIIEREKQKIETRKQFSNK